jgi:hypothetical protein
MRGRRGSGMGWLGAGLLLAVGAVAVGGAAHASGASAASGAVYATTGAAAGAAPGSATQAATGAGAVYDLGQPVVRVLSTDTSVGGDVGVGGMFAGDGSAGGFGGGGVGDVGSSVIGETTSGDPEAYFLNLGNYSDQTAEFVAVDLKSKKTVLDTRVPSGYSNNGLVYSRVDAGVFMATGHGSDLYEYRAGGTLVTDLGPTVAGQTISSLAAGPDGKIWGGTYPGGDIFCYDPVTGEVRDYGQAVASETYVTALLPTASGVYFGTQPDTDFGELDPGTGAVTQIPLPAAYAGQAGKVGGLSMAGTRVFVAIEANVNAALVWDTVSQSWVATISPFSDDTVSPPDPDDPDYVYYRGASGIVRYDIATLTGTSLSWAPNAIPGGWAWVSLGGTSYPGQTLMFTYYADDRVYGDNLRTNAAYRLQPTVQGSGDQLICLGAGPDGDIYAGAFLTPPGMGQWSPVKSSWSLLPGSGQVEGYGTYDGDLVFGRYPQGSLYYDDTSKGWHPSAPAAIGDNQNRPVAFAQVGSVEAVGSVPVSGRLGGDISRWDPATGAITVYHDPVPGQTPVSLVAHDGLLWGGTSIDGGYGVKPTATSGELFAFDPGTGKVVFQLQPKQGAVNVSGLALDASGDLWGLADSTLFEFSLSTRRIVREEALASKVDGSMYGIEHKIVFADGRLFATTDEKLFQVDTVSWKAQTLYNGPASDLTHDRSGRLYFVQEPSYVYRYDPPVTDAR